MQLVAYDIHTSVGVFLPWETPVSVSPAALVSIKSEAVINHARQREVISNRYKHKLEPTFRLAECVREENCNSRLRNQEFSCFYAADAATNGLANRGTTLPHRG